MFVPLPELDDRRFNDLVEEGRALIPIYAPAWTDHNAHDPGITVMELLAWIAETAIYGANRISDRALRAFLALVGVEPGPARPAAAVVQFEIGRADDPVRLRAGTELQVTLLDARPGLFQLVGDVAVLPARLVAVQTQTSGRFREVSSASAQGKTFALFGDDPLVGDALYLGFDLGLTDGSTLRLELQLAGDHHDDDERARIEAACTPASGEQHAREPLRHHSVQLVWEGHAGASGWVPLDVVDGTRAATLSGSLWLTLPATTQARRLGSVDRELHYLRCRVAAGSFDAAPRAASLRANAARVRQIARAHERWSIATGVAACGAQPPPGGVAWLTLEFKGGEIVALSFGEPRPDALRVRVLCHEPATNQHPGSLLVEALRIGMGDGAPNQRYDLPGPYICPAGFELYSVENGTLLRWQRRASLEAQGAADRAFSLDVQTARVVFGDGQNGRVPPPGAVLIAVAESTSGTLGNVPAETPIAFAPGDRDAALLCHLGKTQALPGATLPGAAGGGEPPEALIHAEGRALQLVQHPQRAVTLTDCEGLARETPGTAIARAAARANVLPGLDCYAALGFITVVVIPYLPKARPQPSPGLIAAVSAQLNRRRVLGTRIVVTGPEYLEVAVNAEVRAVVGQNKSSVRTAIEAALRAFLDPLEGGPDGAGWPLGRDVFMSEILATLSNVPGVDHVVSAELEVPGCGAQCGDVCVRPLGLVVSGTHRIQVS